MAVVSPSESLKACLTSSCRKPGRPSFIAFFSLLWLAGSYATTSVQAAPLEAKPAPQDQRTAPPTHPKAPKKTKKSWQLTRMQKLTAGIASVGAVLLCLFLASLVSRKVGKLPRLFSPSVPEEWRRYLHTQEECCKENMLPPAPEEVLNEWEKPPPKPIDALVQEGEKYFQAARPQAATGLLADEQTHIGDRPDSAAGGVDKLSRPHLSYAIAFFKAAGLVADRPLTAKLCGRLAECYQHTGKWFLVVHYREEAYREARASEGTSFSELATYQIQVGKALEAFAWHSPDPRFEQSHKKAALAAYQGAEEWLHKVPPRDRNLDLQARLLLLIMATSLSAKETAVTIRTGHRLLHTLSLVSLLKGESEIQLYLQLGTACLIQRQWREARKQLDKALSCSKKLHLSQASGKTSTLPAASDQMVDIQRLLGELYERRMEDSGSHPESYKEYLDQMVAHYAQALAWQEERQARLLASLAARGPVENHPPLTQKYVRSAEKLADIHSHLAYGYYLLGGGSGKVSATGASPGRRDGRRTPAATSPTAEIAFSSLEKAWDHYKAALSGAYQAYTFWETQPGDRKEARAAWHHLQTFCHLLGRIIPYIRKVDATGKLLTHIWKDVSGSQELSKALEAGSATLKASLASSKSRKASSYF